MLAQYKLNLLGGFQLFINNRPVPGLNSTRLQFLLAAMVLRRNSPQPRQRLAFLLWPDATEEQARTNLRKVVLLLRRAFPTTEILLSTDGNLQWNPNVPFTFDIADFEDAVKANDSERAVALYTGDLLPDCYEEWILEERERLKQLYLNALQNLVQEKEGEGAFSVALNFALRLLQCDPLREETHRLVMHLHALNGDRAAVLRAYQNCATLLKKELGVDPSISTQQYFEQLQHYNEFHPIPTTVIGALPFVGRKEEWLQLLYTWREASQGRVRMAVISGESGIGKTRLAEELLTWVQNKGISSASARCYEMEGELAYAPVKTWLHERPISTLNSVWLTEVARLLPELASTTPIQLATGSITESWQRQRFHEGLARAVLGPSLGIGHPLLLMIDDIQWCDASTLEWLHFLLRFNPKASLLVLATLRDDSMRGDSSLPAFLASLRNKDMLVEIELNPLNLEDTRTLGQYSTEKLLDTNTAKSLFKETEGNPLFVIEYARAGSVTVDKASQGEPVSTLPRRVQTTVATRLAQLSWTASRVMDLAAVIGRDFTFEVLAKASREDESTLIQALDELWRRRVIREQGEDRYDFSHDKLRQVAYERMSSTRRRWLHKQVAQALIELDSVTIEALSGQIGWHFAKAGNIPAAIQYLRQASQSALKIGAFSDAIIHLNRALDLIPESDLTNRYLLILERERIYHLQADRNLQAKDIIILEELATAADDGSTAATAHKAQVMLEKGTYLRDISNLPSAISIARQALSVIDLTKERCATDHPAGNCTDLIQMEFEANYLLGTALEYQGNYQEAILEEEKALGLAKATGMRWAQARALSSLAACYDDVQKGMECLLEALPVYRESGDKPGESTCLEKLGYLSLWMSEYEKAANYYKQSLHISQQIGFRPGEVAALFRLGHFYNQIGDYYQGKQYLERALPMALANHNRRRSAYISFNISVSELGLEQVERARQHVEAALKTCQEIGDHNGLINAWNILGSVYINLGCWEEAATAFQQALELVRQSYDPGGIVYCQARLAMALLGKGETHQALSYVEKILAFQGDGGNLQGTDEGLVPIYEACYCVLDDVGDTRSRVVLETAYTLLQKQLSSISDSAIRHCFEMKSENRLFLDAWKAAHPDAVLGAQGDGGLEDDGVAGL